MIELFLGNIANIEKYKAKNFGIVNCSEKHIIGVSNTPVFNRFTGENWDDVLSRVNHSIKYVSLIKKIKTEINTLKKPIIILFYSGNLQKSVIVNWFKRNNILINDYEQRMTNINRPENSLF